MRIATAIGDAGIPVGECQLEFRYGKGLGDRDRVLWRSLSCPSVSGDPIMKLPAGTTTISGQSVHSLKTVPRLERLL